MNHKKRFKYISYFVNSGNNGEWEFPYKDYEQETLSKIYNEDL